MNKPFGRTLLTILVMLFSLTTVYSQNTLVNPSGTITDPEIEKKAKGYCVKLENICRQHQDLMPAMRESAEIMKALTKVSTNSINCLIGEFKDKTKDWKYRYLVLIQLAYTKDERVVNPAIESLKDEADEIRGYSAVFLGEMKCQEAVEPLINTLNDKNRQVRVAACKALGKIGDEKAIKPILERFKKEDDFVARTDFISYTFGKFRDEKIFSQLLESLAHDVEPDVRIASARTLGEYNDERTIGPLSIALDKDEHPLVRLYAALSLGKTKRKEVANALEKALKDENKLVRQAAKRALEDLITK